MLPKFKCSHKLHGDSYLKADSDIVGLGGPETLRIANNLPGGDDHATGQQTA